jgi:hypothetical protein
MQMGKKNIAELLVGTIAQAQAKCRATSWSSAEPTPSSGRAPEPSRWFRSHTRAYGVFN